MFKKLIKYISVSQEVLDSFEHAPTSQLLAETDEHFCKLF